MGEHSGISSCEAADRPAIRQAIEVYARCGERRDARGQIGGTAETFAKLAGIWPFAERQLRVDGVKERGMSRRGLAEEVLPESSLVLFGST